VVRLLLARDNVNMSTIGEDNETPLSLAAYSGLDAVVEPLRAWDNVEVNVKDETGA
jgi:hypothetical protein